MVWRPRPLGRVVLKATFSEDLLVGGLPAGWRAGFTPRAAWPEAWGEESREEIRRTLALSLNVEEIAWKKQVHGAELSWAEAPGFCGEGDGLMVREGGPVIGVGVADCGPLLLWDRSGRVGATIHAGWRGVAAGIVEAAVARLRDSGATELSAWLGPCIGSCCFEVGPEVAEQFPNSTLAAGSAGRLKNHVDLGGAIRERLVESGLDKNSIVRASACTHCDPGRFFSYRRDGGIAGRHLLWLKPPNATELKSP